MTPLTEAQIRASFVNMTKGEVSRLHLPGDLAERPWDDLDYLGWRDPGTGRSYLVAEYDDGRCGVALRLGQGIGQVRKTMCSLCTTVGAVDLMVAKRAGRAGQRGDSVGTYICADLACSLYARGKRRTGTAVVEETLTVEQKVERLVDNLEAFLARVLRQA